MSITILLLTLAFISYSPLWGEVAALMAILVGIIWTRLDSAARTMEPYFILSGRNAHPDTLNLEYVSLTTFTGLLQSIRRKHFVLASVMLGTICAQVLPVILAASSAFSPMLK